jgi:hypothetical protein
MIHDENSNSQAAILAVLNDGSTRDDACSRRNDGGVPEARATTFLSRVLETRVYKARAY